MKKYMVISFVIIVILSLTFIGVGCKEEVAPVEEVTEETTTEETTTEETITHEPVTLKILHKNQEMADAAINTIIEQLEQKYSWITVQQDVVSVGDYPQAKLASYQAGAKGSDLYIDYPGPTINAAIDKGVYLDCTQYPQYFEDLINRFPSDYIKSETVQGPNEGVYAFPLTMEKISMWYNTEMFQDNGIAVPQNIEEFYEVCDQFKSKGIYAMSFGGKDQWPYIYVIFGLNAAFVDLHPDFWEKASNGEIKPYTDEVGVRLFVKEIKSWFDNGWVDPGSHSYSYGDETDNFITGKNPMLFSTVGDGMAVILNKDPNFPLGVDRAPFYTEEQGPTMCAYAENAWTVNALSENLEAASLFLNTYYDNSRLLLENLGHLTNIKDFSSEEASQISSHVAKLQELANESELYDSMNTSMGIAGIVYEQNRIFAGIAAGAIELDAGMQELEELYETEG